MGTEPNLAEDRPRATRPIAAALADLAERLQGAENLPDLLDQICDLTVTTVPHAEHAGITLLQRNGPTTVAATSSIANRVDEIEYVTGEGPCLDAIKQHRIFRTDDLAQETRWPLFAPQAVEETSVRSMLGVRLTSGAKTIGALNLYSTEVAAFADDDVDIASLIAAHVSVALVDAMTINQLEQALATRDVISTAKGILMGRHGITEDEAFDRLRATSRNTNTKLVVVAERIVGRPA